ncbi:MAG: hypothetical protein RLZZ34_450 [Verrucomicrobiota bacterium]|jgi:hypothetical protein
MKPLDLVGPWNYALDHFLKSFLEVAFPVIAAVIDWKVTPVSLDKELREIMPEAQPDPERFDRLFQFRLISGLDAWLLIHFEFNNHPDPDLENRLDERCRRLFQRFGVGVTHVTFLAGMD